MRVVRSKRHDGHCKCRKYLYLVLFNARIQRIPTKFVVRCVRRDIKRNPPQPGRFKYVTCFKESTLINYKSSSRN